MHFYCYIHLFILFCPGQGLSYQLSQPCLLTHQLAVTENYQPKIFFMLQLIHMFLYNSCLYVFQNFYNLVKLFELIQMERKNVRERDKRGDETERERDVMKKSCMLKFRNIQIYRQSLVKNTY